MTNCMICKYKGTIVHDPLFGKMTRCRKLRCTKIECPNDECPFWEFDGEPLTIIMGGTQC